MNAMENISIEKTPETEDVVALYTIRWGNRLIACYLPFDRAMQTLQEWVQRLLEGNDEDGLETGKLADAVGRDEEVERGEENESADTTLPEDEANGELVVVLADGETWTMLPGCSLVFIPEEAIEICNGNDADNFRDMVEEELGEAVASRIVALDLAELLEHGCRLAEYEKHFAGDGTVD